MLDERDTRCRKYAHEALLGRGLLTMFGEGTLELGAVGVAIEARGLRGCIGVECAGAEIGDQCSRTRVKNPWSLRAFVARWTFDCVENCKAPTSVERIEGLSKCSGGAISNQACCEFARDVGASREIRPACARKSERAMCRLDLAERDARMLDRTSDGADTPRHVGFGCVRLSAQCRI